MRVESSNIAEVDWWDGALYVTFLNGRMYRYEGVPLNVAFEVAVGGGEGSVGKAFWRLVRGRYVHTVVWAHRSV